MRRPWIKIETCTPDKPEICSLATQLRLDEDTVVGKLVRLWSWAELNRIKPNDIGVTKEFIDKVVGRKGFAAALAQTGWLVETNEKLQFRNFSRHNSPVAQNKALTAKRVARHRLRKSATQEDETPKSLAETTIVETPEVAARPKGNVKKSKPTRAEKVTPEPLPEPIISAAEAVTNDDFPDNDSNVITHDSALIISEESAIITDSTVIEPAPSLVESPIVVEAPVIHPEITPEEALAALQLEEAQPKKRRSKAAAETSDQPMLF